ncbi:hypothetical protein RISK_001142 [Rhodopirellula islandica]|uniref:Uncharacterized protein n=1 Tax=Rhodopirellula islandica TaxID=595434 RepID=A0A0J1BK83_RHOIS|nr:hypothetical protein RISK_001142 [Rhodopirellula islandica]
MCFTNCLSRTFELASAKNANTLSDDRWNVIRKCLGGTFLSGHSRNGFDS